MYLLSSLITPTMSLAPTFLPKKWAEDLVLSMLLLQLSFLVRAKEKDGKEVVGNLIKAKTVKSRLSKENQEVTIRLYYDERGLDRYYGLLELGELGGLWKNVGGRYEIDGKKVYAKAVYADPEKYFTPEVLEKLDVIAKTNYGA